MPRSPPPPPPPDFLTGPPQNPSTVASSAVIVAIVVSSAVIASAAVYLLLRLLSRRCRRSPRTFSVVDDVIVAADRSVVATSPSLDLISSLPSFTFGSVGGTLTGGDCAVCLGRFESNDLLRLLPLCCHAFHAQCVDTWLVSNLTCPLCRTTVHPSDDELLDKILSQSQVQPGSNSFRVEIGSISRRSGISDGISGDRRSYSVGEFDYVVDEGYDVLVTHRQQASDDKEHRFTPLAPEMPPEELAASVGNSRSWLREYVDRLASVSSRSSGRFFTGSSRRSEVAMGAVIGEEYRVGEEISELFRWLSGV